jgi:hypothetical protein
MGPLTPSSPFASSDIKDSTVHSQSDNVFQGCVVIGDVTVITPCCETVDQHGQYSKENPNYRESAVGIKFEDFVVVLMSHIYSLQDLDPGQTRRLLSPIKARLLSIL